MKNEPEDLDIINDLMYRENIKYKGDVKILHLLEIFRDEIDLEKISQKVSKPLKGLKLASYYGCYLVRPAEIGFDRPENPTVMDDLVTTLGATAVDFPHKTECCGAYQTVDHPEAVADRTNQILTSARSQGAEAAVVSCPLCAFNLDHRQKKTLQVYPEFKNIPILYFTQLTAIAFGCPEEALRFDLHYVDPRPLLKEKGLL
jgi:heterodisulfide reductase subunit B